MFYLITAVLTFLLLVAVEAFLGATPFELLMEATELAIKLICLPFIPLWVLVRNVFKPVPSYKLDKEIKKGDAKVHHFVKNIYLLHDTETKIWYHKFFFVRVFQAEEPKPFPIGKYKIGEEKIKKWG